MRWMCRYFHIVRHWGMQYAWHNWNSSRCSKSLCSVALARSGDSKIRFSNSISSQWQTASRGKGAAHRAPPAVSYSTKTNYCWPGVSCLGGNSGVSCLLSIQQQVSPLALTQKVNNGTCLHPLSQSQLVTKKLLLQQLDIIQIFLILPILPLPCIIDHKICQCMQLAQHEGWAHCLLIQTQALCALTFSPCFIFARVISVAALRLFQTNIDKLFLS